MTTSRVHATAHRAATLLQHMSSSLRLHGATSLGARARVIGTPHIKNRGQLHIGADFVLSSDPVTSHIVVSPGGSVVIGNGVCIGSGAAIACERHVSIGNSVQLGRGVLILDTDFHRAQSMEAPGDSVPIVIEAGARVDDNVVVLKGAVIGAGARIAAESVVAGAITPGAFAQGVPARPRCVETRDLGDPTAQVHAVVTEVLQDRGLHDADSLDTLRLLVALEEAFSVRLPEDALTNVTSVDVLVDIVARAQ